MTGFHNQQSCTTCSSKIKIIIIVIIIIINKVYVMGRAVGFKLGKLIEGDHGEM